MGLAQPSDLFNPRHYAACREPVEVAQTLPNWCYTSPEFYERERERIFLRHWMCITHESKLPNPGSYHAFEYAGVPMVLVRGKDGVIRAFINACRHRGAEVVAQGEGQCTQFQCPYHAWTYGLDGKLIGTPMFEESAVFQKSEYPLTELRCEKFAGFLFVNADPLAPRLSAYLGDLEERVAGWRSDQLMVVWDKTRHVDANWKQYYENFSDPYHVPFVHKSSLSFKPVSRRQLHDPAIYKGNYVMHRAWFEGTRGVKPGEKAFPEMPVPAEDHGSFYPWVYPATGFGFAIDSVFCVRVFPEGPQRMRIERSLLVPAAYRDLPDYEETLENYLRSQETVQSEDIRIFEIQQRSVRNPLYKTGRFATLDRLVYGCQNWILDRVLDEGDDIRPPSLDRLEVAMK